MLGYRLLLVGIASALIAVVNGAGDLGIPGTTQTISGYDTELGQDPICWKGSSVENFLDQADKVVTLFPNKLVENFVLMGETELRSACPNGTWIEGYAPEEFGTPPHYNDGIRPRAGEWYSYRVKGSIDLTQLEGNAIVSDQGTIRHAMITAQVLLCELGQSGFCSPFIHEQSNARMQANNITQKVQTGDRHGGTHVHSPHVFVNVTSTEPVQTFEVEVPMLVKEPGNFFAICALNFFTSDFLGGPAQYRHDVGNALDQRLISYQSQATILHVSDGAKITSWVCSGLACLVILFLLFQTIKHRSNRVIQLSQGSFLIVFLLAALVASASVFLLDPKNDVYCNLANPMILIPLQLLYGVTIARLWRINAVISPLLATRMEPQKQLSHRFVNCVGRISSLPCLRSKKASSKSLRRSVSESQLAWVVLLFTLPQVLLQIFSLTLQPNELVVDFNSDESTGRATCEAFTLSGTQLNMGQALETYAALLLLVTLVGLMIVSTQSRNLPSLFNETRSMYDSTLLSILILVLGTGIVAVSDSPTTTPDVEYIVTFVCVLCITLNTTLRIMLPKLKLVWRGETVLVSQLVSDCNAKRRRRKGHGSEQTRVSGFTPRPDIDPESVVSKSISNKPKSEKITEMSDFSACEQDMDDAAAENPAEMFEQEMIDEDPAPPPPDTPGTPGGPLDRMHSAPRLRSLLTSAVSFKLPARQPKPDRNNESSFNSSFLDSTNDIPYVGPPSTRVPIVITDDETPTRRLVLPMFELQRLLDQVNRRITSGSVVPHEEWVALKDSCEQMGSTFQEDVIFEWEGQDEETAPQDMARPT